MMYLSKVTRPGTFKWSLEMKLGFICCNGVPRCQTLGSERASSYAASADRLEAWQFTEVPAVELRDDAMCQVTSLPTRLQHNTSCYKHRAKTQAYSQCL